MEALPYWAAGAEALRSLQTLEIKRSLLGPVEGDERREALPGGSASLGEWLFHPHGTIGTVNIGGVPGARNSRVISGGGLIVLAPDFFAVGAIKRRMVAGNGTLKALMLAVPLELVAKAINPREGPAIGNIADG